jgi:hypothetical protein
MKRSKIWPQVSKTWSSATLSAHAVGHDREQAGWHTRVAQDRDLILLVGAVALVCARGSGQPELLQYGAHDPAL